MTISFIRENKKLSNGDRVDMDIEYYTLTFKKVETEEDEKLANYFIEKFEETAEVEIFAIDEMQDLIEGACSFDKDTIKEVKATLKELKKTYKADYKKSLETTEVEEKEETAEVEELKELKTTKETLIWAIEKELKRVEDKSYIKPINKIKRMKKIEMFRTYKYILKIIHIEKNIICDFPDTSIGAILDDFEGYNEGKMEYDLERLMI